MRAINRWALALVTAASFAGAGNPAMAQGVFPAPEDFPNLRLEVAGTVNTIVKYNDGLADHYLIGGDFELVNGTARANLARLAADGSLDTSWSADTDGVVHALALSGDRLFVAGEFSRVEGMPRARLAQVDADDGVLAPWAPDANNSVFALQVDATHVWAGGLFTSIEGAARNHLARIDAANGTVTTFNAQLTGGAIHALLLDGADLYVGGQGRLKGNQRALVKVAADTGAALSWNPGVGPQGGSRIRALAADATSVYAAGRIRRVNSNGNTSRGNGARFQKSDAALLAWNPAADAEILTLALDAGAVFLGGDFLALGGHSRLAKVDATSGAAIGSWTADADRRVAALLLDGAQLLVGGGFDALSGTGAQGGLARLATADAAIDAGFAADAAGVGAVGAFVFDAAGGVIVGGSFDAVRQGNDPTPLARRNLVRLLPAGGGPAQYEIDPAWSVTVTGEVLALASSGNDLFLGGNFSQVAGSARSRLAKLAADTGSLDAAWQPGADAPVRELVVDEGNDRLYVLGDFINLATAARAGIGRVGVGATGAIDGWNPAPDDSVDALLLSAGGVYAGGAFGNIGGAARVGLARLDAATGGADPGFVADLDAAGAVHALAEHAGQLYVGGQYGNIGGSAHDGLARVDAAGLVDAGWNPSVDGGDVSSIAIDAAAGHVYFGGTFATAGGQLHPNLARAALGNGGLDASWRPGSNRGVIQLATPEPGQVLAAGAFTAVTGATRHGVALLGVQGSDLTQTSITAVTPVGGTAGADSVFGQGYTVAWSVVDSTNPLATPTGTVTVTASSGESCGPVPVAAGECTLTAAGTGARTLVASFSGDPSYLDSASAAAPHTVLAAAVTLTVATAPLPSSLAQVVDANVALAVAAPGAGTPQGSVVVTVDGAPGCTVTLPATSCSLGAFAAYGFYDIEATYIDSNAPANHAGDSAASVHAVGTLTAVDLSVPATATVGTAVTASVSTTNLPDGAQVVVSGGSGCTITIGAGSGSCALSFDSAGVVAVSAAFAGAADLLPSQGQASVTVSPITTVLDVALVPASAVVGQTVAVNLTTNLPDGAVVTIGGAAGCSQIVLPATSCNTSFAAAGAPVVAAAVEGTARYTAADDAASATVSQAATAFSAFNASSTIATAGSSIDFSWALAVVAPGQGVPGGDVRVSVGGNGTSPSCTVPLAAGGCSLAFPSEGLFEMRVEYLGDANFAPAMSAGLQITIAAGAPVEADLQLAKIVSRSRHVAANQIEELEYTIVVLNAGPATVTGATITDLLPAGLANAVWTCVADDAGAACGAPGGNGNVGVTADLAVDSSVTILLRADVASLPFPGIFNTASVASPPELNDPVAGNNTDTVLYQTCAANAGATLTPHLCIFRSGYEAP